MKIMVERNNKGIKYEKKGKIDEAIELYEMNVKDEFDGTHPYDRLSIIYRKRKQYDDEIRVLRKKLTIFEAANNLRLKRALQKASPQKNDEIIEKSKTFEKVWDDEGRWIIFNPYNLNEIKKRIEKAQNFKNKVKHDK